ncbi:MAG: Putative ammonium transporter [Candidatus Methanolliviera sp. GoM_oil]|nr:MAG: Putative ammonium transporter [Candidatus Methanolliviera sp. GoM_oil]
MERESIRGGIIAIVFVLVVLALTSSLFPSLALAADPSGEETLLKNPGLPVDYVWILLCGFLVMFMQAGFAMLTAGFCRAKNATNLMAKNLMDFVMGSLVFFIVGYALMLGGDYHGLFGTEGFLLLGSYYDVGKYLQFFWMLVFCATSATIVAGAVAERLKFSSYLVYSTLVCAIIYPIFGHWMWGGGWLSQLGALDFAGSGVVHAVGGFVGLAGALVLGPRFGKFVDGKTRVIPGHSMTLAALGTFILWFGWFGFNPGSTFSAHELRIAIIAVNTNLAAAAGGLTAVLITFLKTRRWDLGMALNGVLAGLVAVTCSCAWIEGWAAVVIGLIGGALMYAGVNFFEYRGIDDPVGAVSVHGINGIWGLLSLGIFADGTYQGVVGLLYGGGFAQLISQSIAAAVVIIWAFGTGYLIFKGMDLVYGIRVSPEEEISGLDVPEHGGQAYPDFIQMNR